LKYFKNTSVLGVKAKKAFLDILLDAVDDGNLTIKEVLEEVNTFMFEVRFFFWLHYM